MYIAFDPILLYIYVQYVYASTASVEVLVHVECVDLHIKCLCICKCKPALMLANVFIHCSRLAGHPVQCTICLLRTPQMHIRMSTLMVCECEMIFVQFNSACVANCFGKVRPRTIIYMLTYLCMGDVPTVYCCRHGTP